MTKELIIIALICALFYLYQQNQAQGDITTLKEKKISDLENSLLNLAEQKIKWEKRYNELEAWTNQQAQEHKDQVKELQETNQLQQQKITDLETQLLNLAKQKIKGQKAASELLEQLAKNWQQEKQELIAKHEELITNYHQQEQHLLRELAQKEQAINYD